MIKIVIVEDNDEAIDGLKKIFTNFFPDFKILNIFKGGEEAYPYILKNEFDWLILDVDLAGEINGFQLLELLDKNKKKFKTIFFTAHNELAINAIRENAFDFLTKPLSISDLKHCYERYVNEKDANKSNLNDEFHKNINYFIVNTHEKTVYIDKKDIIYVEAEGAYSILHYENKKIKFSKNLYSVEKNLNSENFIRINRFTIINKFKIKELIKTDNGDGILVFVNNIKLPISRKLKNELNNTLSNILT